MNSKLVESGSELTSERQSLNLFVMVSVGRLKALILITSE
jgi:hypothetical protein